MKQRSLAFTERAVAEAAEAYVMARVYRIGSREKAYAQLRSCLNKWRRKAKRKIAA